MNVIINYIYIYIYILNKEYSPLYYAVKNKNYEILNWLL